MDGLYFKKTMVWELGTIVVQETMFLFFKPAQGNIADGMWHHVAFVADTDGGHIYVDRVLDTEDFDMDWNPNSNYHYSTYYIR